MPFFFVYFDTAFFFGAFFVARPIAAPTRAPINGIGILNSLDQEPGGAARRKKSGDRNPLDKVSAPKTAPEGTRASTEPHGEESRVQDSAELKPPRAWSSLLALVSLALTTSALAGRPLAVRSRASVARWLRHGRRPRIARLQGVRLQSSGVFLDARPKALVRRGLCVPHQQAHLSIELLDDNVIACVIPNGCWIDRTT